MVMLSSYKMVTSDPLLLGERGRNQVSKFKFASLDIKRGQELADLTDLGPWKLKSLGVDNILIVLLPH